MRSRRAPVGRAPRALNAVVPSRAAALRGPAQAAARKAAEVKNGAAMHCGLKTNENAMRVGAIVALFQSIGAKVRLV